MYNISKDNIPETDGNEDTISAKSQKNNAE